MVKGKRSKGREEVDIYLYVPSLLPFDHRHHPSSHSSSISYLTLHAMSTDTLPSMDHQESAYYDRLFTAIDKDNVSRSPKTPCSPSQSGLLPGHDALPFLISSNLPQSTLGEVWAIADIDNNGFLTRQGWYKAARLIGWLQNGESVATEALTSRRKSQPLVKQLSSHRPTFSQICRSRSAKPSTILATPARHGCRSHKVYKDFCGLRTFQRSCYR